MDTPCGTWCMRMETLRTSARVSGCVGAVSVTLCDWPVLVVQHCSLVC